MIFKFDFLSIFSAQVERTNHFHEIYWFGKKPFPVEEKQSHQSISYPLENYTELSEKSSKISEKLKRLKNSGNVQYFYYKVSKNASMSEKFHKVTTKFIDGPCQKDSQNIKRFQKISRNSVIKIQSHRGPYHYHRGPCHHHCCSHHHHRGQLMSISLGFSE